MASTYSDLKVELIGTGEQTGTWGTTTNNNLSVALGEAITGSADVVFTGADVTLTLTDTNAAQTARNLRLNLTGTSGGARQLILGSGCQIEKLYLINNGLADPVTVKNTTGTGVAVPAGKTMFVYNNGTNVVEAVNSAVTLDATTIDTTNLEVTNIKAKDGTASASIANSTGALTVAAAFSANGGATLGDASGDALTINSSAVSIPNGLNFDSNTLVIDATNNRVGIGTVSPASSLDVNGNINGSNYYINVAAGTMGYADASASHVFYSATGAIPNTQVFNTNGSERVRINSIGNVGIGTASPTVRADIVGASGATRGLVLRAASDNGAYIQLTDVGSHDWYVGTPNNTDVLVFGSGRTQNADGTELMRIDSSGNVGIGTTSTTQAKLVVNGGIKANGGSVFDGTNGYSFGGFGDTDGGMFSPADGTLTFATNNVERMRIDSIGNVGIGETSTTSFGSSYRSLVIKGTNGSNIDLNDSSGTVRATISTDNTGGNGLFIDTRTSHPIVFRTTSGVIERMRITSGGSVGIGTSNVAGKLTVVDSGGAGVSIGQSNENFYAANLHRFFDLSYANERMRIDSSGNVAINTTSGTGGRVVIAQANTTQPAIYLPTDESTIQGPSTNTQIRMGGNLTVKANNVLGLEAVGASGYIAFNTSASNTERMRITSGGNVSIGTVGNLATLDVKGNISPTETPSTAWGLDFAPSTSSGTYVSIANDATYDIATGSGFVYIYDDGGNGVCQIACYYGITTIVWQNGTFYNVALNNANTINVYYNSGTGKYRVQNKTGSSKGLFISTIRMRTSS